MATLSDGVFRLLSVCLQRPGVVVVGQQLPTALAAVRDYLNDTQPRARVGLIHRLDREASGLLVFSTHALAVVRRWCLRTSALTGA
jgi:23S rRNA-/tRNA-specific pseudouridylate synthase